MNVKKNALKLIISSASLMLVGLLISKLLNYFYRAMIARWFDPTEYGIFSLGLNVLTVVLMITVFGFSYGVERFIGYYQNRLKQNKIFRSAVFFTLFLSIIFSFLLYFSSDFIALKFFKNTLVSPVIKVLSFSIPFFTFLEITVSALKAWKYISSVVWIKRIIEPLSKIFITFLFLHYSFSAPSAALAYTITGVILVLFSLYFIKRFLKKTTWFNVKSFSELFYFSWPLLTTGFLYNFITSVDTFMLGYYLEESFVGLYGVAVITASLLFIPQVIFESLFIPVLSGLYRKNKTKDIKNIYLDVSKYIFYLALPILLFLSFYGKEFVVIFFGNNYSLSYGPLLLLCVGYFFSISTGPNSSLFNIFGDTKIKFYLRLFIFVLNILMNIMLIPKYGVLGAAISTGFAVGLTNVVNVIWYYIKKRITPISVYTFRAFLCGIFAILFSRLLIAAKGIFSLLLAGFAFAFFYILLLYITKTFTKKDLLLFYNSILKNR